MEMPSQRRRREDEEGGAGQGTREGRRGQGPARKGELRVLAFLFRLVH